MTFTTDTRIHTINADGRRLGHVATEAAKTLQGKDQVTFARNTITPVKVVIENASKMDISSKRAREIYQSYSGFPGGRKTETLDHLANRLGYAVVLEKTIKGMLPKNRLQKPLMLNLEITE